MWAVKVFFFDFRLSTFDFRLSTFDFLAFVLSFGLHAQMIPGFFP
jgi:hypothetical protein